MKFEDISNFELSDRAKLLEYLKIFPVFAFNFNDVFDLQGIVGGIQKYRIPTILMASPTTIDFLGAKYCKAIFDVTRENSTTPLFLQLDHAHSLDKIHEAINLDFDIIMADMSHLKEKVNIKNMIDIINLAKRKNILIEGELGNIDTPPPFTPPFDANHLKEYSTITNLDLLAFPCGNQHGFSQQKPPLDFKWIKDVASVVDVPLVLHGADYLSTENLITATKMGIRKINIGPELRVAYINGFFEKLSAVNINAPDHRTVLSRSRELVREAVSQKVEIYYKALFET